jgi:hypothetical protein
MRLRPGRLGQVLGANRPLLSAAGAVGTIVCARGAIPAASQCLMTFVRPECGLTLRPAPQLHR